MNPLSSRYIAGTLFTCGLFVAAGACSKSVTIGKTGTPADEGARTIEITHEECAADSKGAEKTDVNNDGRADITRVMRGGKEVCRVLDLNFDGKVDSFLYFDDAGNLRRRESDFDRDGLIDEIGYYEAGKIVRKDRETNLDGKLDTWDTYENEKIAKRERDTNADGKVDQWWTFPDASKLECPIVATDQSGDGRPDTKQDICKDRDTEQGVSNPAPAPAPAEDAGTESDAPTEGTNPADGGSE